MFVVNSGRYYWSAMPLFYISVSYTYNYLTSKLAFFLPNLSPEINTCKGCYPFFPLRQLSLKNLLSENKCCTVFAKEIFFHYATISAKIESLKETK